MRSALTAAAAVVPLLLLAGCGGDDVGTKPDLPDETPALWNPCDVLDAAFIETHLGTVAEENDGEPTAPQCRFAPAQESGQPVVEVNYQLFSGDLDDAWEQMGQPEGADVTEPVIAGADDARVVTSVVKRQLYVTGFVENGDLIQVVNVVDPAPYDERAVVAGVEQVLTRLSTHAAESGVEGSASEGAE